MIVLFSEDGAKLTGKKSKPAIEPSYCWRDWAAKSDGALLDHALKGEL